MHHSLFFLASTLFCCSFCYSIEPVDIREDNDLIDYFQHSLHPLTDVLVLQNNITLKLEYPLGVIKGENCKAFEGIFNGNNHSIGGIDMKTENMEWFTSAGLFCELRNATIRDLIIDNNNTFNGSWSGALSCRVSGSLTLVNVQNHAFVTGREITGGFIGRVESVQSAVLSFENCLNNGTVEKTQSQQHGCGGFIGDISGCQVEVTFRNCTNSGTIQGIHVIGGFIGMMENNSNSVITFESTGNQGTIQTGKGVGGLIGASQNNTESSISFLSCKNSGSISGEDYIWWVCWRICFKL